MVSQNQPHGITHIVLGDPYVSERSVTLAGRPDSSLLGIDSPDHFSQALRYHVAKAALSVRDFHLEPVKIIVFRSFLAYLTDSYEKVGSNRSTRTVPGWRGLARFNLNEPGVSLFESFREAISLAILRSELNGLAEHVWKTHTKIPTELFFRLLGAWIEGEGGRETKFEQLFRRAGGVYDLDLNSLEIKSKKSCAHPERPPHLLQLVCF